MHKQVVHAHYKGTCTCTLYVCMYYVHAKRSQTRRVTVHGVNVHVGNRELGR